MIYKSACPHCGGHIEFEAVHLGRTTSCPHCNGQILLNGGDPQPEFVAEASQPEPSSWNVLARVFRSLEEKQLEQSGGDRQHRIDITMQQVRDGTWQVEVSSLVLSTGERALWRQAAAAVDPGLIGGQSSNSAFAMTAKIFKSITTRLIQRPSQIRAQPTVDRSAIPGEFIITTSRLVFTSKDRTFITRYENLADVMTTLEGVRYFERGKAMAYGVRFNQPNGDIIGLMIDHCMAEACAS